MKESLDSFSFGNQDFEDGKYASQERRASTLREWYRKGQAYFRGTLSAMSGLEPTLKQALHAVSGLGSNEREGFLMGWQSDKYAYDNNLPLSVEGGDREATEDLNGFTYEDEGSSVLAITSPG